MTSNTGTLNLCNTQTICQATIPYWLSPPSKSHGLCFTELSDTFPVGIYLNFLNCNKEKSWINTAKATFCHRWGYMKFARRFKNKKMRSSTSFCKQWNFVITNTQVAQNWKYRQNRLINPECLIPSTMSLVKAIVLRAAGFFRANKSVKFFSGFARWIVYIFYTVVTRDCPREEWWCL